MTTPLYKLPESITKLQQDAQVLHEQNKTKRLTDGNEIGNYGKQLLSILKALFDSLKDTQEKLDAKEKTCATDTATNNTKIAAMTQEKEENDALINELLNVADKIVTGPTQ